MSVTIEPKRVTLAAAVEEGGGAFVMFRPEFARVCGSADAGMLLSYLVYWFLPSKGGKSKLSVTWYGKRQLVKSRAELMSETGLTEWKLRAAVKRLEELGLVESSVHLFGNKTRPHLHLDEPRLKFLLTLGTQVGSGGPIAAATEATSVPVLRPPPDPYVEEYREEYVEEKYSAPREKRKPNEPLTEVKEEDTMVVKLAMNAPGKSLKDVMEERKSRLGAGPVGTPSAPALAALWKSHRAKATGQFQKAWTNKDLGQAKKLCAALQNDTWPIVKWALEHWGQLVFTAKDLHGKKAAPSEPHLGWLLQYHDVAHREWADSLHAPAVQSIAVSVPVVQKLLPVVTPVEDVPATEAEVLEILKGG